VIVIRLTRVGKKNQPYFRIVAAEKQAAVKGKFLEILGHWNPRSGELVVDQDKLNLWKKKGAQLSDTAAFLIEKKPKPFKEAKSSVQADEPTIVQETPESPETPQTPEIPKESPQPPEESAPAESVGEESPAA